jgi:hypothetical protein
MNIFYKRDSKLLYIYILYIMFTTTSGITYRPTTNKYNFGFFVRGKGGNHKIARATINLGSTKGRGSSTRIFNYCNTITKNQNCLNQFINI